MLSSIHEIIRTENTQPLGLKEVNLTESVAYLETKPASPNTQFSLLTFTTHCLPLSKGSKNYGREGWGATQTIA